MVPLKLEYCHTRLATGNDAELIGRRFREACRALGTEVGAGAGPAGRHLAPVRLLAEHTEHDEDPRFKAYLEKVLPLHAEPPLVFGGDILFERRAT